MVGSFPGGNFPEYNFPRTCCVVWMLYMGNFPIVSLMFTTFSLILIPLNVLDMGNFKRIFFSCFDMVGSFFSGKYFTTDNSV